MANFLDYLRWRGDLTFKKSPITAIDAAILSTLVYLPLDELMRYRQSITLHEIALLLLGNHDYNDQLGDHNRMLLRLIQRSPRFAKARVTNWANQIIANPPLQFSAMTVRFPHHLSFVVYRGTDQTMAGWNEDMTMSWLPKIPGQERAAKYLKQAMLQFKMDKFYVTGHSKGGNYAVYASASIAQKYQEQIAHIYNFDGPGFENSILKQPEFTHIQNKISTFIPQGSIFGQMLYHNEPVIVVKAQGSLLQQHDPINWEVARKNFVKMPDVNNQSMLIDQSIKEWVAQVSPEDRALMWTSLFDAFKNANITSVGQITDKRIRGMMQFSKAYLSMSPEARTIANKIVGQLITNVRKNISDILPFLNNHTNGNA